MEIFGYDFIIDQELNPWLIEVNTNPCLEESSTLLKVLLPRMIDDALKLTLDQVFPPKRASRPLGEIKKESPRTVEEAENEDDVLQVLHFVINSEAGLGSQPNDQLLQSHGMMSFSQHDLESTVVRNQLPERNNGNASTLQIDSSLL